MMIEKYNSRDLEVFLKKNKVANIKELKFKLGTASRNTVLRKLNELGYKTSYSHNGAFYTLEKLCQFNVDGLWSHKKIWFSSFGTLLNTGKTFVEQSDSGVTVAELDKCLSVSTKLALIKLSRSGKIYREKYAGVFVYFSGNKREQKRQILSRREEGDVVFNNLEDDLLAHELKAAIILFFALLDEQQRRIFAGLESIKIGAGGDKKVAAILGIDPHTVAKGRKDLLDGNFNLGKVRRKGGGRKSLEKKLQK
jgi:hypothetical protein